MQIYRFKNIQSDMNYIFKTT